MNRCYDLMSEESVRYLEMRIEEDYLAGEYFDDRGAVEVQSVEVGNLPTHDNFYVHFTCESYHPDKPKGRQYRRHVGTWIGDFDHYPEYSNVIENMEGEIRWTYTFPGSGTTVYQEGDDGEVLIAANLEAV